MTPNTPQTTKTPQTLQTKARSRSSPRFARSRIVVATANPTSPPPPPPSHSNDANPLDDHRQRAREAIRNANERRIAFEKENLEKIAAWQSNIKQIVKDDLDLLKQLFNGPRRPE